ncbi:MAG: hypothetical protein NTU67_11970 [Gemmatimonadetes bacterium]|nr:hypothetical protein [Gemmatimonadota bacterium]
MHGVFDAGCRVESIIGGMPVVTTHFSVKDRLPQRGRARARRP